MRRAWGCLAVVLSLYLPSPAGSHSGTAAPAPRCDMVGMTGEIVDPMCYCMHDGQGPAHASCAERCARRGQTLAFLDVTTGNVYPLIGKMHEENPNNQLYKFIGKPVEMRGAMYRKGSSSFLQIVSIALAAPQK